MDADLCFWRCMCGKENSVSSIDCRACEKQRWSQLGFDRTDALGIAAELLPKKFSDNPKVLAA